LKKGIASKDVDAYISESPKETQPKLREVRAIIKEVAPKAVESISYRIPYYHYKGRLVYFALMKSYIGLYLRPPTIEQHGKDLAGYVTTKSAVHIPLDKDIPRSLIKKLVKAAIRKNEAES
jgi:uncharacterized protein YdhG (YjbR/CyaY superfamily)